MPVKIFFNECTLAKEGRKLASKKSSQKNANMLAVRIDAKNKTKKRKISASGIRTGIPRRALI